MNTRARLVAMVVLCAGAAWCGSASGQTAAQASAFYKEFDDATLFGMGPLTKDVYGGDDTDKGKADRRLKIARDIFDNFSSPAGRAVTQMIFDAHGKGDKIKAEDRKKTADAFTKAKDDGVLQRLSDLQRKIMKKHFEKDGGIDFDKFQKATEMFANGELRGGGRQMDQLYQWTVWKKFAEVCIDKNVDKADWEKLLKSLEAGLEIQRVVYPAPARFKDEDLGELIGSDGTRYDDTKKRTEAQKKDIRDAIAGLTTPQVIARQSALLKDMTPAIATAAITPRTTDTAVVSADPLPGGGYTVNVLTSVRDLLGVPAGGETLMVSVYGGGLTFTPDAFRGEFTMSEFQTGLYGLQISFPTNDDGPIGFYGVVHDLESHTFDSFGFSIPTPGAGALLAGLGLVAARRRRGV